MRITEKIIEILKVVGEFKYLPIKSLVEISRIQGIYSNWQYVYLVVKKLEEYGYLRSYFLGSNSKILCLTKKSEAFFCDVPNMAGQISAPKGGHIWRYSNISHSVQIAEVYISLLKEVKKRSDIEILNWHGDHQQIFSYSYRSVKRAKSVKRNLIPDSFITLAKKGSPQSWFLEFDTGTMDRQQLSYKFKRYFEYFIYGDWSAKYGTFPGVFFLTQRSPHLLEKLLAGELPNMASQLDDRSYLKESKNIIVRGISNCENLESVRTQDILAYLSTRFYFIAMDEPEKPWEQKFLEQL